MVANLHLLHNRGAVVRDRNVAIGGNEDLIETAGSKRGLDDVGHSSRGEDVGFDGLVAVLALLPPLTAKQLVEQLHFAVGVTYSLTTMKGRPCSSFIIVAGVKISISPGAQMAVVALTVVHIQICVG